MSFGEQLFDVLMLGKEITERCNNFSSSPCIPLALVSYAAPALQTGLAKPESVNHHPSQGSNTKSRVKLVFTCVRKEGTEVMWLFLEHSGHIVGQLTLSPPRIMASQYDSILFWWQVTMTLWQDRNHPNHRGTDRNDNFLPSKVMKAKRESDSEHTQVSTRGGSISPTDSGTPSLCPIPSQFSLWLIFS